MKPFNLASWIEEWTQVAERNEKLAEKFAGEGLKVTANEYYSRASKFYRKACWPMPVTESRMLPLYKKTRETIDKAWRQIRPPFERVQVNYEGQMGGYGVPRAASGESRIAAALMSSGSFDLGRDLFDYYPRIQERVRWIVGARDLTEARKKLAEYTVEGRANRIECPIWWAIARTIASWTLQGAFRLYSAAINSKREMVEGTGHAQASNVGGPKGMRPPELADWAAKHLVTEG